jgi:DNA-directed RNA polymerase specialized sigma24 family protein
VNDLAEQKFVAEVKFRLTDHDYGILRHFEQRSSLRTSLAVVIYRLLLDYRKRHQR